MPPRYFKNLLWPVCAGFALLSAPPGGQAREAGRSRARPGPRPSLARRPGPFLMGACPAHSRAARGARLSPVIMTPAGSGHTAGRAARGGTSARRSAGSFVRRRRAVGRHLQFGIISRNALPPCSPTTSAAAQSCTRTRQRWRRIPSCSACGAGTFASLVSPLPKRHRPGNGPPNLQ